MKELDTNTKSALMKRIDDFVENERSEQPGVPDTTIMMLNSTALPKSTLWMFPTSSSLTSTTSPSPTSV